MCKGNKVLSEYICILVYENLWTLICDYTFPFSAKLSVNIIQIELIAPQPRV